MPASEILRIAATVGAVQLVVDLVAYYWIFRRAPYQRSVELLERYRAKWEQVQSSQKSGTDQPLLKKSSRKQDQNAKKVQRAEDDYKNSLANVVRRHTVPNFFGSVVFLILMKILGTEMKGHIVAILPFEPFSLLQKLTSRGLEFGQAAEMADDGAATKVVQACSFTFVYILSTMSVKYYVHQLFGYSPPPGAESVTSLVDSPMGQNSKMLLLLFWSCHDEIASHNLFLSTVVCYCNCLVIRSLGMEPVDFKEARD